MFATLEEFSYARCHTCGCLQIISIPSDLARFYPPNYYSYNTTSSSVSVKGVVGALRRARMQQRLFDKPRWADKLLWRWIDLPWFWTRVRPYLKREWLANGMATTFLDVGCGSRSWWLEALAEIGFGHLQGADPFISADQTNDGIPYRKASLTELDGTYDFISLHHSLEHIPDQAGTFRAIAQHLSDNGTVLIRIPVIPNALWDEYGDCCMSLDPPRHLYLHTLQSLQRVAALADLQIVHHEFDSEAFNILGCEQYRLGITLFGERSYFGDPTHCPLDQDDWFKARERAMALNANGTADQAAFILRKKVDPLLRPA